MKQTKFILHGGFNSGNTDENNSDFYVEILKDAPENTKVLVVPFAKDEDRVEGSVAKVTKEFNANKWQENISVEKANEASFVEQLQSADVVYLHGGVTFKLLEVLKKFSNIKELLQGKTIAGESAGANVLGEFFYSPHADAVGEGLGILPFKIIPHYTDEQKGKLENVGTGLEEVFLPEYRYRVFCK